MRSLMGMACAVLIGLSAPALADKRVALVIGNSEYRHADKLANPLTDARNMRDTLTKLGFEVVFGENLDKRATERTVGRFATAAQGADVALVFYAGHGATFGDTPYVVPVDAAFSSLAEMPYELVPVETLIGELRQAKGLRIAILDACRDNAAERNLKRVASRGGEVTRGLGRVRNPDGLILAYATQYLSTAADGVPSGNSPFTAALLNNIATPGLDVKDLFFRVGRDVIASTGGVQRPEIAVSFYDSYSLVPGTAPVAAATAPAVAPADPAERAWAVTQTTTSVAVLETFVRQYGATFYGSMARARLEELKRSQLAAVAPPVRPAAPPTEVRPAVGVFTPSPGFNPLTAARERSLKPKDTFKECDTCPEMVVVPAGRFTMGSPASEKERSSDEGPQHTVTIGKPFAVGKFSVTFAEWDACVADGGCNGYRPDDKGWGRGNRPVINVNWNDAQTYVAWLSRKTGKTYRLLTEAEREYVARAGTTTPFWWGSSISTGQANYDGNSTYGTGSKGVNRAMTMPVDSFQPNPFGLYQVHGNVWEWTEDCWHGSYAGAPSDGSAWTSGDCSRRVLRGGSWYSDPGGLRAARRGGGTAGGRSDLLGFRLARTLTP